jgi:hypothetical protein
MTPMSLSGEASTARHEPSLTLIASSRPRRISTTVWSTSPPPNRVAAPLVRLCRPEMTADNWSARSRGSESEAHSSKPSLETTIVCAAPGVRRVNELSSQANSSELDKRGVVTELPFHW